MLTNEQLEQRKHYIGGSDMAAICNKSPYETAFNVWNYKTGKKVQPDISDLPHIKFGNYVEPCIGKWFADETGKEIIKSTETIFHKDIPYLAGNLDFELTKENAILECKTAYNDDGWGSDKNMIPLHYRIQVAHYCAVGGYDKVYVAVFFCSTRTMQCYEYNRHAEAEKQLLARAEKFWNENVQKDIPPEPTSTTDFIEAYPDTTPEPLIATATLEEKINLLKTANEHIKRLEKDAELLKVSVFSEMKDKDTLVDAMGNVLATWKKTRPVHRFDSATFAYDHQDLYVKYLKEGSPQRRFLLK
jgi:putative phage-type endonuclease